MMLDTLANSVPRTLAQSQEIVPGGFWMPPQYSNMAPGVDWPFMLITWLCIVCFVGIIAVMGWFMFRYSRARGVMTDHSAANHNTAIEITWSAVPLVFVILMFWVGFEGFMNMQNPPANAYQIDVTAQKWDWLFTYPNGHKTNELHVPAGEPVKLMMSSKDVLHAVFIPDFRVKQDIVPGKFSSLWFEAYYNPNFKPGELDPNVHHLFCAEYCGTNHSNMITTTTVHATREDYEAWLEEDSDFFRGGPPLEAVGARLYQTRGCKGCHSLESGIAITGPSLKDAWRQLSAGERRFSTGDALDTNADLFVENYIAESLRNPLARIVEGFGTSMPTFKGQLDDTEIGAIVKYILWLQENDGDPWADWKAELERRKQEEGS